MINPRSDTWKAVVAWAADERRQAVEALIADRHSEQQRGRIAQLDELLALAVPGEAPTPSGDHYV